MILLPTLLAAGAQVILLTVTISLGSVSAMLLMPTLPDAVALMSLLIATVIGGVRPACRYGSIRSQMHACMHGGTDGGIMGGIM